MTDRTAATIPDHGEGVAEIVKLAQAAQQPEIVHISTVGMGEGLPEQVPVLISKTGSVLPLQSAIEAYRLWPGSRKGTAQVDTLASFIDLTNRHKDEHSVIFASASYPGAGLTAVIDYHQMDRAARHGKHRVTYPFPLTDEFMVWAGNNGREMEQAAFAAFLEEHMAEMASPFDQERSDFEILFKEKMAAPNEVFALARDLEIFAGQKIKRAERLQSGEREVAFVEEHLDSKGEKVSIPGIFMIQIAPFVDGAKVRIAARLRYRVKAGTIIWFYQLWRWKDALRDEVKRAVEIATEQTALPAYLGQPES